MSNRPVRNKKKVIVEDYDEPEVPYRSIGRSPRELVILGGVVLIILAFVLAPMLAFMYSPEQPEQSAQQAENKANDVDMQISQYKSQLEGAPNDPTVLANLGYYTNQKAAQVSADPKDPSKGKAESLSLLQSAEGYLKKSLSFDPNYDFAQQELSKNLLAQEKYDEAGKLIDQILEDVDSKVDAKDPQVAASAKNQKVQMLVMSSLIDAHKEDLKTAVGKVEQAIALDKGNPQLYVQRGQYYVKMGDKAKAKEDFEATVDIGQKTGDQRAAIIGQMMLESLNPKPPAAGTPGAVAIPTATSAPGAATDATPVSTATP